MTYFEPVWQTNGVYTKVALAPLLVNGLDVERTLLELLRRVADLETHIVALKASTT